MACMFIAGRWVIPTPFATRILRSVEIGLARSFQRRRETLRNRKFLGRGKERTDLHESAMACQSETASSAGGLPQIDAYPIRVELEMNWTPARTMVLDSQHRRRETNPLGTSRCVETGVKGPGEQH